MQIPVKRLVPAAVLPTKSHDSDAGWDLYCLGGVELSRENVAIAPTGIAMQLPKASFALVSPRSGLALKGVVVLGGVIDAGYRGEVLVILGLIGWRHTLYLPPGSRIAQLVLHSVPQQVTFHSVDSLDPSDRNEAGLGSTGR